MVARSDTRWEWTAFAGALADALEALEEGQHLILRVAPTANHYVQLVARGARGVYAEAVSNAYLSGSERLSDEDLARLVELGWRPPRPGGANGATGSQNFSMTWSPPVPFAEVARVTAATLREVYRAGAPHRLRYSAGDEAGRRVPLLLWGIAQDPPPAAVPNALASGAAGPITAEQLRAEVETTLRQFMGLETVVYDESGAAPFRQGTAAISVRVAGDPPFVQVFSPLLTDIEESVELLEAVNELNSEIAFARIMWTGQAIVAVIELFGIPYTPPHLLHAFSVVSQLADDYDDDLQRRFGGRTSFGGFLAPPEPERAGGYL